MIDQKTAAIFLSGVIAVLLIVFVSLLAYGLGQEKIANRCKIGGQFTYGSEVFECRKAGSP